MCGLHIRWQRRRHYFCSQFVSEVLEQSGALALPKDSTLMHPNDYTLLPQLKCLYKGRLADLPQRKAMDLARRPRWSASIPACWWSCCSAGRKGFLSNFVV